MVFPFVRFECAPSQHMGFGHYQCSIHMIQKLDIFYQCHLITRKYAILFKKGKNKNFLEGKLNVKLHPYQRFGKIYHLR